MPVLKSEKSRSLPKDAIVLDMGDLDRQAKRIIERAREEEAAILAAARREAQELIAEAAGVGRAQGLEQGMKEGRERGRAEGRRAVIEELKPRLEELLESWGGALDRWEQDRAEMLLGARQDVLTFALDMGRRISLRAIEADSSVVLDQAAEALAHLTRPTAVTISAHPDDRALLEEALPALLAKFTHCTHAALREEPSMQRGGCVLSTGSGEIDASIDTQLDQIVEALLPSRKQHGAEDA